MALDTKFYQQFFKQWFANTPVNGASPTPIKAQNAFIILDGIWYIHQSTGWYQFTPSLVTGGVE